MATILSPRRYEPEELFRLAKSPLCQKPSGLPPIEEWMGVMNRPASGRSRTENDVLGHGNGTEEHPRVTTTGRRSSFFESRLSRSSIPEDIVLGPPKMSFASSSARTSSGKFEPEPIRTAGITSTTYDDDHGDSPRFERFKALGGFVRNDDKEKDSGRDFSDLRGGFSKRRDEGEGGPGWTNVSRPPRKSFGAEDSDRFRKELRGEAEKKGGNTPWDRDRPAKYENFGKERDREHRGRGKRDESSWLLDDHRGDTGRFREHGRFGSRVEKDPEWLDSDGRSGDHKATHSMEDFQKWKERMKAQSTPSESQKKLEDPTLTAVRESAPVAQEKHDEVLKDEGNGGVSSDNANQALQAQQISQPQQSQSQQPIQIENGVDRFFGFWSGNSILKSPEQGDIIPTSRAEHRAVSKSRFTDFFSPQESNSPPPHMPPPKEPLNITHTPPYTQSPAQDSSNEDREGFQRILKMLGGTSLDPNPASHGLLARPPQPSVSPAGVGVPSPHAPPLQSQQNHHPVTSPPARDPNTDFFMRLMQGGQPQQPQQQPQQSQPSHQQHQHQHQHQQHQQHHHQHQHLQQQSHPVAHTTYGGPSQMPPPPQIDTGILPFNRGNSANGISQNLEDPVVAMFRQRPNQDPSPILPRGPPQMIDHHGPPPGWNPQVSQAPPPQSHRPIAPPPGFNRGQHQHQQGPPPPPQFMPPPGVSTPLPFQLLNGSNGPLPHNMAPPPPHMFMSGMNGMNGMNGGPPPLPGANMSGPPPPGGFPIPFPPHHHPEALIGGIHGPPFGFPNHDSLKNPPFNHGPPGKGVLR